MLDVQKEFDSPWVVAVFSRIPAYALSKMISQSFLGHNEFHLCSGFKKGILKTSSTS